MVNQYNIVNLSNQGFWKESPQKSKHRTKYSYKRRYPVKMRKTMEKLQIIKFKRKIKRTMMIIKQQSVKVLLTIPSAKAPQIGHILRITTMKMQLTLRMQIE
jgi:hypothetical protein